MPEFVEYRLHFPVREQRWTAFYGRCKVAAKETGMRLQAVSVRNSSDESIHPRAAPLAFSRIPVGIERADQAVILRPILIVDLVILNLGMPHRHSRFLHYANAVEPLHDLEHPLDNAAQREVRPNGFFIEIVDLGATFFGVIGDIARLEFGLVGA